MVTVAGRSSMGKSAFAITVMANVIQHQPHLRVGLFSLEMPTGELMLRLLSQISGVEFAKISSGCLPSMDVLRLEVAIEIMSKANFFIDDQSKLTMSQIASRSRRAKRTNGLDLVIVDYLQLVKAVHQDRPGHERIEEISGDAKALAKELDLPIMMLAQLNRGPEGRPDGLPKMSDLRGSGAIEQDSDVVILCYREKYYANGDKEKENSRKGLILVDKNRNGATGAVPIIYREKIMKFEQEETL